jgi:chemotaxis protein methyltransferase CheR
MTGPFDAIFCRNVMIYFDRDVRERLVSRFHGLLREGGLLYVGHSESLTGLDHSFQYVRPAVYRR